MVPVEPRTFGLYPIARAGRMVTRPGVRAVTRQCFKSFPSWA
jgi:hypothetical protein